MCRLLKAAQAFTLGAKPGVADAAAEKLKSRSVNVVGAYHGYFDSDDDVISDIKRKNPDVVLVCLGAPRQEKWIYKNRHKINAAICIGAGERWTFFREMSGVLPPLFRKCVWNGLQGGIAAHKV